jgi:hypothetical protein
MTQAEAEETKAQIERDRPDANVAISKDRWGDWWVSMVTRWAEFQHEPFKWSGEIGRWKEASQWPQALKELEALEREGRQW